MRTRIFLVCLGAVLGFSLLGVAGPAAESLATAAPEVKRKPPSPYRGKWFGTTAQGDPISLSVNRQGRITLIKFGYEIEGEIEGDDCTADVEDEVRGPIPIKKKAFEVKVETKQETFTFRGRFGSRTAASGRLIASFTSDDGCAGDISTTWTARKGKPPVVMGIYDGTWQGPVSLPPGLDPAITALADPTIELKIEKGKVTFVSAPWIVQGIGCEAALAGRILWDLEPPVALSGDKLDVTFSSSAADTKTWDLTGAFDSAKSASGMLTMSGTSGAFVGACTGSLQAPWQATKMSG